MSNFPWKRVIAAGTALGIAAFVAIAMSMTADDRPVSANGGTPTPKEMPAAAKAMSDAFAQVAHDVSPAVVGVYSERLVSARISETPLPFGDQFFGRFFGGPGMPDWPSEPRELPQVPQSGMGSGMVLDRDGTILTNNHVVNGAKDLRVRLADRRLLPAEVVATDAASDVAVIRIKSDVPKTLATVRLGDSDKIQVGHLVMAIGAPFGYLQTVTTGVLSARDRSGVGINNYEDFLQTDAAINPGNSGGPLVNMAGEVIGINSAIATQSGQFSGVGFAIPINMVKAMLPTLRAGRSVERGQLGVVIQELTPALARQFGLDENTRGALVAQVKPDSPADKAGLQTGDAIVRFEGHAVDGVTQLRNLVAGTAPGTKVEITALREGHERSFKAELGRLDTTDEKTGGGRSADPMEQLGFSAQTLTPELAPRFGYAKLAGALIAQVDPGTAAAHAGLRRGDLVVEAARKPIKTVGDLSKIISRERDSGSVLLRVRRGESSLFVVLNFD